MAMVLSGSVSVTALEGAANLRGRPRRGRIGAAGAFMNFFTYGVVQGSECRPPNSFENIRTAADLQREMPRYGAGTVNFYKKICAS
jgi:hypothetical protein